jgi:hypothetical protein
LSEAINGLPMVEHTHHGSHLPPSWRTLYELTKLPDDVFEARIANGTICADMQRKDTRLASFSGDNERYTLPRYIELAREVMGGIDCDPASNGATATRATPLPCSALTAIRQALP